MRHSRRDALLAAALALSCAHANELVPAAGATTEAGHPRVAEASDEGVRLTVNSAAWDAGIVRDALSPVLVSLENGGPHPLRVAYSEFTLASPQGFRIQALPPFRVAVQNATAAVEPAFGWYGFSLAPWDARFYRHGLPVWGAGLAFDPAYYAGWEGAWPASLPDEEVLRRALPEGVLDAGGRISGFLYFPDQPKGTAVTFTATLVDAQTSAVFGTLRIPFTVK